MENDALLCGAIVVQAVEHRDINQVVRGQSLVALRFKVVRRAIISRPAGRREEKAAVGVVRAAGQEFEHQEGVRRATLAQIYLNRVAPPLAFLLDADEIDAEATKHAALLKHAGDFGSVRLNLTPVGLVRRKAASEKDAATWSSQYLVVG